MQELEAISYYELGNDDAKKAQVPPEASDNRRRRSSEVEDKDWDFCDVSEGR